MRISHSQLAFGKRPIIPLSRTVTPWLYSAKVDTKTAVQGSQENPEVGYRSWKIGVALTDSHDQSSFLAPYSSSSLNSSSRLKFPDLLLNLPLLPNSRLTPVTSKKRSGWSGSLGGSAKGSGQGCPESWNQLLEIHRWEAGHAAASVGHGLHAFSAQGREDLEGLLGFL